jgi:hypothetical protein
MAVPEVPASADAAMSSPMAMVTTAAASVMTTAVVAASVTSMTATGHRLGRDNQRSRHGSDQCQFSQHRNFLQKQGLLLSDCAYFSMNPV